MTSDLTEMDPSQRTDCDSCDSCDGRDGRDSCESYDVVDMMALLHQHATTDEIEKATQKVQAKFDQETDLTDLSVYQTIEVSRAFIVEVMEEINASRRPVAAAADIPTSTE